MKYFINVLVLYRQQVKNIRADLLKSVCKRSCANTQNNLNKKEAEFRIHCHCICKLPLRNTTCN